MFNENPLSNPEIARACGIESLLPDAQSAKPFPTNPPYIQQQTHFQPVTPVFPQTVPAIDTATIQGLTNAINQATKVSQQQQQQLEKQHIENTLLRNNIQRMKTDKVYSRYFIDTVEGIAMCTESDGLRNKTTTIGVISIIVAQSYRVPFKDGYREYTLVKYIDSHNESRETIVTSDEISTKNLVRKFHGFEYQCKSKSLANEYLADRINKVKFSDVITLYEYPGFYSLNEKAFFNCNWDDTNPEIVKFYPPCVASRKLKRHKNDIVEIQQYVKKYLHTPEKCLIFTFSICGLLSNMLNEIGYCMEQYLAVSAPDFNSSKQATIYLQLYEREISPLSFDDTKKSIQDYFSTARDETFVITDCSNIDNQKRRSDILSFISALEKQSLPHNTAVISTAAQFLIPAEKKSVCHSARIFIPIFRNQRNIKCVQNLTK